MSIETEHKGYKLTMYEESETWSCFALEVRDCASLAACKAAVNKLLAKDRRLDLPALVVSGGGGRFRDDAGVTEIVVSMLCQAEKTYGIKGEMAVRSCWAVYPDGERHKLAIDKVYPIEARAELKVWLAMDRAAKAAQKSADEAHKAIRTHDVDTLALAAREKPKVPHGPVAKA